ncbi:MAG: Nif3-like dinuclear metal center hexameric protein [Planctomycetota bacterium]
MFVRDLTAHLHAIAPLDRAASWDNVGLLAGAKDWPAHRVLLTIDLTPAVIAEAIDQRIECIVAYHPPIFTPLKTITDSSWRSKIILDALAHRIAIYSPHTALDAVPGGVNDWLLEPFGPGDVESLEHATTPNGRANRKIVTFCPADAVATIRNAMAHAGAGEIGAYAECSFELTGYGSFRGDDSTSPAAGTAGQFERQPESRLEMVCSDTTLAQVVRALRNAHPYEEPAFDIYALTSPPDSHAGMGRLCRLASPRTVTALAPTVASHLGVTSLRVSASASDAPATTVGVCAGAGGSLLDAAIARGCDLFLTGEMRYHDVLDAQARGCTVMLAGHSNTERGYLPRYREAIAQRAGDSCIIEIASADQYPLTTLP